MPRIVISVKPRMLGRFENFFAREFRCRRIRKGLDAGTQDILLYLFAESQQVFYRGEYRNGWFAWPGPASITIGNTAPHFMNVEMGRRPGATQPPLEPIRQWVLAKGMHAGAAFPVARAIGIRGIKSRPLFTTEATQNAMEKIMQKHLTRWIDKVLVRSAR